MREGEEQEEEWGGREKSRRKKGLIIAINDTAILNSMLAAAKGIYEIDDNRMMLNRLSVTSVRYLLCTRHR